MPSNLTETGTRPINSASLTVRTLRVDVVEGPDRGRSVETPEDRLTVGTALSNQLVLTDPTVSRFHLEIITGENGVRVHDLGSRNGTWLGSTALERARIPVGTKLALGHTVLRIADGAQREVEAHTAPTMHGLLGATPSMRRLMGKIERVAKTPVSVLVTGESGTGKELVARALHEHSTRAQMPFVVVDCGALTASLVASALFGHERGAFTGADKRRIGAFERANGGSVFLDEIGELPLELQPQLLGVLERRRFQRLGGTDEIDVDVRVVAATHRDLRSEVNRGSFREDLYYRLAVVSLEVPPLRERLEDLPLLAEHFFREAGGDEGLEELLNERTLKRFTSYDWPGNVRELRNLVEATFAMGEAPDPSRSERPGQVSLELNDELLSLRYAEARNHVLDVFEQRYLSELLNRSNGNVSKAARSARMDRSHLIKLLQKHQLR